MERFIQLHQTVFPDFIEGMQNRYIILNTIDLLGPVGRRTIMEQVNQTERYVRNEITFLQKHNLVTLTTKGVQITQEGKKIVVELAHFMNELSGLAALEKKISAMTGIDQVLIVHGNCDEDSSVKQELGRTAVAFLQSVIDEDVTIAVTGGTTMAAVAAAMEPFGEHRCLFVPARGGTGERVENQANTIVAKMAAAEKGDYKLLHVPDPLSEALYQTLMEEPSIEQTLSLIQQSSIVLHGVGDALTIAERRNSSAETIAKLKQEEAVGETFGYYFNKKGNIVFQVRTIGIQLDQLPENKKVITIAGGESKAEAIASFLKLGKSNLLITDEAAAKRIIKLFQYK